MVESGEGKIKRDIGLILNSDFHWYSIGVKSKKLHFAKVSDSGTLGILNAILSSSNNIQNVPTWLEYHIQNVPTWFEVNFFACLYYVWSVVNLFV